MTAYRLDLPWNLPPLSLNDRSHWAPKAKRTREVRTAILYLARSAKLPTRVAHATVTLNYAPSTNRRRDTDNLFATAKACFDGLVDAGLVPDDTPQWMAKPEPIIHPNTGTGRGQLWLDIEVREAK